MAEQRCGEARASRRRKEKELVGPPAPAPVIVVRWERSFGWEKHLAGFHPKRPWLNAFTQFRKGAR